MRSLHTVGFAVICSLNAANNLQRFSCLFLCEYLLNIERIVTIYLRGMY